MNIKDKVYGARKGYMHWFRKHVVRLISFQLSTKLFIKLGISGNAITATDLIISIIGSCLLFFGIPYLNITGAILLLLGIVLDNCDGEVARYNNNLTLLGGQLDNFKHIILNSLLIFGLSSNVYANTGLVSILYFGFFGALFSRSLFNMATYFTVALNFIKNIEVKPEPSFYADEKESWVKRTYKFVMSFLEYPINIIIVSALVAINNSLLTFYFIIFYTFIMFFSQIVAITFIPLNRDADKISSKIYHNIKMHK